MKVFKRADILLPSSDMAKWAVIACDQHTGNAAYWKSVYETVGDAPSAVHITLPEIYLGEMEERKKTIAENMRAYLSGNLFTLHKDSMVYVERETKTGIRRGVVGLIDLSAYDYRKGSKTPVRATEKTVEERLPPRIDIRKNAYVELPHILILIDDREKSVIEPCASDKTHYEKAYSADLMLDGGHIDGYFIDEAGIDRIEDILEAMCEKDDFVFAVGDGNHSLAAAKESVDEKNPLSRYALCEIVNIHDPSLVFEPIYRVVFGISEEKLLSEMESYFGTLCKEGGQRATVVTSSGEREISLPAKGALTVATLTEFLDLYISAHPEVTIDYIHGEDEARRIASEENAIALLFDVIGKNELFDAVRKDGALVRKTFSMGEACDKRYYIEARKIK